MPRPNWLIASIEPEVWADLSRQAREVELQRGDLLQSEGEQVVHVYFPEGAMIGLFSSLPSGNEPQSAKRRATRW